MEEKNPISALQELMSARGAPYPVYTEEGSGTSFKCTVLAASTVATAVSSTKKDAKRASARNILKKLKSPSTTPQTVLLKKSKNLEMPHRNYVGELNEFASKNKTKLPVYSFITCDTSQFLCGCGFLGKKMLGLGITEKDAKQDSAKNMLELLKTTKPVTSTEITILQQTKIEVSDKDDLIPLLQNLSLSNNQVYRVNSDNLQTTTKISKQNNFETLQAKLSPSNNLTGVQRASPTPTCSGTTAKAAKDDKSPNCALHELTVTKGFPPPVYTVESHGTSFKCTVLAAGVEAIAVAPSKKEARLNSARNALTKLKSLSATPQTTRSESSSVLEAPVTSYIADLCSLAFKHGVDRPEYTMLTVSTKGVFICTCAFFRKETYGLGTNKKVAKQESARQMFELIRNMEPFAATGGF